MSWNKNTVIVSEVDATVRIMDSMGMKYQLHKLGEVANMGLEVQYDPDVLHNVPIRAIEFVDVQGVKHLLIVQMQRTLDCDSDDFVVSFHLIGEAATIDLTTWPLEISEEYDPPEAPECPW